jgi:CBS domain-containing protein
MLVKDVMNKHVITVEPDTPLLEAAQIMADNHIGCLVVVQKGKPIGMVTERDILVAIASEVNIKKSKVKDIMTHYLITIGPNRPINKAIKLMTENKIKKLPVVDEKGKLVGIITTSDIISAQPKASKNIKKLITLKLFRR